MSERSRKPSEAAPQRLSALARLPVFLDLGGKRAVLAGGTPGAAWKAELLAAAGAHVQVFAHECCEEMAQLIERGAAAGSLTLHPRELDACRFRRRGHRHRRLRGRCGGPRLPRRRQGRGRSRATRSTGARPAISSSAPSSTARPWSSASRPTARRRSSRRTSAGGSKPFCRLRFPAGPAGRATSAARSWTGWRRARRAARSGSASPTSRSAAPRRPTARRPSRR